MTQNSVLWLGENEARFVHLSNERMERKTIRSGRPEEVPHHHCAPLFRDGSAYFRAIVSELAASERLLILGVEHVVDRFKAFLKEHFPALCDRVLGWARMDKPVDSEIAALAAQFFVAGAKGGAPT